LQWRASIANPGDREAILAHPDAIRLPTEQIDAGEVYVAKLNSTIVGFAVLISGFDLDGELDGLFVGPRMQRRGIGRLLVEYWIAIARNREFRRITLVGNPHAQGFYAACGCSPIGICQTRSGAAQLMRLDLS
jgi:GNAT superfamily N-acetyltransferase